jgi:flagellar protein FlgJ
MFAASNLSDRLSVDVHGAQALRAKAAAGDPEALRAAAKQFEAMVVQIMLKTMRETRFSAEGDPFGDSSSLKMYQELLDQQWAQKMTASKGLGFAEAIVQRLGVEAGSRELLERLAAEDAAEAGSGPDAVPAAVVNPAPAAPAAGAGPVAPVPADAGPAARVPAGGRKQQFIEAMLPHAQQAEAATGVPARFILAHAALESGWGKREILSADGVPSHNLFGIKATGWAGATAETLTTEYRQGLAMKVSQSFRAYADYGEAFTDYANLLRRRYGDAVAAGQDADAYVTALAKGGYATDPAYAAKLRGVIDSVAVAGV